MHVANVTLQLGIESGRVVTLGAFVRLLPGVGTHVHPEVATVSAFEVALAALVWFHPGVGAHVDRELGGAAAFVVALAAFERLLSGVDPHDVVFEIAAVAAIVVALAALEGLLSSVRTHVPRQVALLPTAVVALIALKRPLAGVHKKMLLVVALAQEDLAALAAAVRAPSACGAALPASPRRLPASLARGLRTAAPRRARRGHPWARRLRGGGSSAACEQERGQGTAHSAVKTAPGGRH